MMMILCVNVSFKFCINRVVVVLFMHYHINMHTSVVVYN
jgi:hypothetical protein